MKKISRYEIQTVIEATKEAMRNEDLGEMYEAVAALARIMSQMVLFIKAHDGLE